MTIRFRKANSRDCKTTRGVVDAAFKPEDIVAFLDAFSAGRLRSGGSGWRKTIVASGDMSSSLGYRSNVPTATLLNLAFLTPLAIRPDPTSLWNSYIASKKYLGNDNHALFDRGPDSRTASSPQYTPAE